MLRKPGTIVIALLSVLLGCSSGEKGASEPRQTSSSKNEDHKNLQLAQPNVDPATAFQHFGNTVEVSKRDGILKIESNGIPEHNMMVGIESWQQQVPISQPYSGTNSWTIPLNPTLAEKPISARNNLFRGAIAIAVNGVPIFNALNNRGEDAYLAGELDKWGGHCGRGDDYHYHRAPTHLEEVVGKGNPIAFALDGFPIYGYTEADGTPVGELDELNGQFDEFGNYHYHATEEFPYINGGLRGEVIVRNGQIEPQPKDSPVRPAQRPLRNAKIIGFEKDGDVSRLLYRTPEGIGSVTYRHLGNGQFEFNYINPDGTKISKQYRRRE